jgi:iron(II)-dependent oxidoreductase
MDPAVLNATKESLRQRLAAVRARTLALMEKVSDEDLRIRVHDFYSPIGWHFGHVGRTEEFWVMVEALKREPLDPYLSWLLADLPDNPKDNRTKVMDRAGLQAYMAQTREVVLEALDKADLEAENPLTKGGYGWDFAIQHECQHQETIAEMLTLLERKKGLPRSDQAWPMPIEWMSGLTHEWLEIPGGEFVMGSDHPFGYDNEKRAHVTSVAPFELSRYPVTAHQWSGFIADGGYRTPSLWLKAGWEWREKENATMPEYWVEREGAYFTFSPMGLRAIHPDEPVGCLSWFEAEAYTHWSGQRMPTEAEWEFAASVTPSGEKRLFPFGNDPATPEEVVHGLHNFCPQPLGYRSSKLNPWGVEGLAGNLWEWTSSKFLPYPGFEAFPYDGYSKDHMLGGHYICRGGSFATAPEILRATFRNWYVPTYRQGFLGLRLAK